MKLKRLGALIILLAIVVAIAVIYFGTRKSDFSNTIEITSEPYDSYSYPFSDPERFYVDSVSESIFRNIELKSPNPNVSYSIVMKDYVQKEKGTNKIFVYNYAFSNKNRLDDDKFYSLEIRAENNSLIHKIQNINNKNIYEEIIAEYWILNPGTDPKTAISLLINAKDPEITKQGACTVEETTSTATGDRHEDSFNFEGKSFQIVFKPENLSSDLLNKYSNQSLHEICGKYGLTNNTWGSIDQGNFMYQNDVLIFLPVDTMWQWTFQTNEAKIIKR